MIAVLERLREDVEHDDGQTIDRQHKALLAIQVEQQALAKVPTWPWRSETLRGMVGALVLPIMIFIVQRVLGRLLG